MYTVSMNVIMLLIPRPLRTRGLSRRSLTWSSQLSLHSCKSCMFDILQCLYSSSRLVDLSLNYDQPRVAFFGMPTFGDYPYSPAPPHCICIVPPLECQYIVSSMHSGMLRHTLVTNIPTRSHRIAQDRPSHLIGSIGTAWLDIAQITWSLSG